MEATCMVVGTVWAISGNVGEWYLLTEKEIYLNRLLEGDIIRQQEGGRL